MAVRRAVWALSACLMAAVLLRLWPSHPLPAASRIHLLGSVKQLLETPDRPILWYESGSPLKLLLDPIPLDGASCDPFAGGSVVIDLLDPSGLVRNHWEGPTAGGPFRPLDSGYLLPEIPDGQDGSAEAQPFLLPDVPGDWELRVTWRCRDSNRTVTGYEPFRVRKNRRSTPFWTRHLRDLDRVQGELRLEMLDAAFKLAPDSESRMWVAAELFQALKYQNRLERAEAMAGVWAEAAREARFPSEEARAWNGASEVSRDQAQLGRALRYLDRSAALVERYEYSVRVPDTLYSRCVLFHRQGHTLQALDACAEARREALRVGKRDLASQSELYELYLLQSLGHLQSVNRRLQGLVENPGEDNPVVLNNLAWLVLQGVKDGCPLTDDAQTALDLAEATFQRSLDRTVALGHQSEIADPWLGLTEVSLLRTDVPAARVRLTTARSLGRPGDREIFLSGLRLEGIILLEQGDYATATSRFESLKDEADRSGRTDLLGSALFGLAEADRLQGRLQHAAEGYTRALATLDRDQALASPLHRSARVSSRGTWAARAIQVRLDLGDVEGALEVAESLQDLQVGGDRQQSGGASSALREQERQDVASRLDEVEGELASQRRLPPSPVSEARIRSLERSQPELWARLEMMARPAPPEAEAPARGITSPFPTQDRAPGLRYAVLPNELIRWEIRAEGVRAVRVPVSSIELRKLVERFVEDCRRGKGDTQAAQRLSALLLPDPIAPVPSDLTLYAPGVLASLPWSALPAGGHFLGQKAILRFRTHHRSALPKSEVRSGGVLIVADPGRDLPDAAREGLLIRDLLPGSLVLPPHEVTRATLMDRLGLAASLHFAGHGQGVPGNPYLSHLKLAGSDRLTRMDISNLRLSGQEIFLNACSTGKMGDDGGTIGLAEGFVSSGARSVIATRWDVPDGGSLKMAQRYYTLRAAAAEGVKGGHFAASPATLLARVLREAAVDPDPRISSPATWAAYFVLEAP